jgi:ferrous iron transport protein A
MSPTATDPVPQPLQPLDQVPLGEARLVAAIAGGDPAIANRLIEMGLDEGVEVVPLHAAPLGGDPIAVRVGTSKIALRRALARAVLVAPRA